MIQLSVKNEIYKPDLLELVKFFDQQQTADFELVVDYFYDQELFVVDIASDKFFNFKKTYYYTITAKKPIDKKRQEKKYLKIAVYKALSFLTGVSLPYGALTGIRPTKLYLDFYKKTRNFARTDEIFKEDYLISDRKLNVVKTTVKTQFKLRNKDKSGCDLFVFIPFCPTRCAYCSFVSSEIVSQQKIVSPYVDCLVKEIESAKQIIADKKLNLRSIYVGGGTPTVLDDHNFERVLSAICFDSKCVENSDSDQGIGDNFAKGLEFTVEAGRPETITDSKIEIMQKYGVNRISINPQTMNDSTLKILRRNHTSDDIRLAYEKAKGKFSINMDLIADLPGESVEDFAKSLSDVMDMCPDNITVHTLYLKHGSPLKNAGFKFDDPDTVDAMTSLAYDALTASGYNPYYMYRQKYTSGNLENIGYSKQKYECIYNIDIMEENAHIMACGANAVSKMCKSGELKLIRNGNYKLPLEYIKNFDKVLLNQKAFWYDNCLGYEKKSFNSRKLRVES